jgi:protein involved in polysaccharide export with SLBB domain
MRKRRAIQDERRWVGSCLSPRWIGAALLLSLAGCGDFVRTPTPEEMAAFEQAGSITPVVDMDRIEKAKVKTGPYRVVPGDVLEFTMPALLQAVTAAEVQAAQSRTQPVNPYLARVRDSGAIVLPAVGLMPVADLSLAQIEERVTDAYKSYIVLHPSVFVRVAEYRTAKVYVSGAVKKPGVYDLQSDQMTLSSLLTRADGISEVGAAAVRVVRSEPRVELIKAGTDRPASGRDGVASTEQGAKARTEDAAELPRSDVGTPPRLLPAAFGVTPSGISLPAPVRAGSGRAAPAPPIRALPLQSLDELVPKETGPKPILLPVVNANIPYRDIALDEGDTVVVEPVQMPLFSVLGLVAKPGNFPYPPGAHYNITQAIAFAGGLDTVARPYYATIYRLTADGSVMRAPLRLIEKNKLTEALGTPIRAGDVVAVENTPRTRLNTMIREMLRINAGVYVTGQDLWNRD